MKIIQGALLAIVMLGPQAAAAAAPTEASVRELLLAMESKSLLDGMWNQLDTMTKTSVQRMLGGAPPTAEQRQIIGDLEARTLALFNAEVTWDALEPVFVDAYVHTFTQHEIDGMLAFYRSDVGRAVVTKMPGVVQSTMQAVQGRMAGLQVKLQQLQRDTYEKLQATQRPH
jgi:hypothetical protein